MVYLVPSHCSPRDAFQIATVKAIRHVQSWYCQRMGNAKTFRLHDPVVETAQLPHAPRWYCEHEVGPDRTQWFWRNVLDDAFVATGGTFHDPLNRWVFYIDAENERHQAVGGNAGVALLPRHDLMGLIGQSLFPGEKDVCRWVGGLGHELGHAFELPHPPGCEQFLLDPSCGSLMGSGFRRYPETFLNPEDIEKLDASRFFVRLHLEDADFPCTTLLD